MAEVGLRRLGQRMSPLQWSPGPAGPAEQPPSRPNSGELAEPVLKAGVVVSLQRTP